MAEFSAQGKARTADIRAVHLTEAEQARLSREALTRQLQLSVRVAIIFSAALFGLPILNWLAPGPMNWNVGGFTLTWLLLAVLFYPLTWVLAGFFIRESDKIEHQITVENRADSGNVNQKRTEGSR
jgi:uncharacterized membrane protein (DUF485 family)